jgi:hypothetical protein
MPYPWLTMMPVRSVNGGRVRERAGRRRFDPAHFVVLGETASFGGLAKRVDGGRDDGHHGDAFLNQKSAQFCTSKRGISTSVEPSVRKSEPTVSP